ncbi:MAG: tetratricopeptide repeat protein [Luteolibacter sp.]
MPDHPTTTVTPSYPDSNPLEPTMEKSQKGLLAIALILILAAGGYGIYRTVAEGKAKAAGEALTSATTPEALAAVTTDHPGTPAAGSAYVLLADSQWDENKKDDAIATLKKFLSTQPEHPLVPTAQANLAGKLAELGKADEATALFEKVADNASAASIAPYALLSLGDLAKSANQPEKAEAFYQRILKDFPSSPFNNDAHSRLQLLRAKPPVEIDAPATPDTDVPEANLLAPGIPSPQIPFENPSVPVDEGNVTTPGNP